MSKKFITFSGKYLVIVSLVTGMFLFNKDCSYAQDLDTLNQNTQSKSAQGKTVSNLDIGKTAYSQLSKSNPQDTYKIVLNKSGKLSLDIYSSIKDYTYFVLTTDDNKQVFLDKQSNNNSDKEMKISESVYLDAGTYYLEVYGRTKPITASFPTYGDYHIKSNFQSIDSNEVLSPNLVPFNKQINGLLTWNSETDSYKIDVPRKMKIRIEVDSYFDSSIKVRKSNNNLVWSKLSTFGDESKPIDTNISLELDQGVYYLDISSSHISTSTTKGKYNFIIREDLNGWIQSNGKWYYYKNGLKQQGWLNLNNKWYYLNNKGEMLTGWIELSGKWYYLNYSGQMITGWIELGDSWYYLNTNGQMATGWLKVNNYWYYMYNSGKMATGWIKSDNNWYYLNTNGQMMTGWIKLGDYWYYLGTNGQMATGWQKVNNCWYYMYSSGKMATNTTIDGWRINSQGVASKIK